MAHLPLSNVSLLFFLRAGLLFPFVFPSWLNGDNLCLIFPLACKEISSGHCLPKERKLVSSYFYFVFLVDQKFHFLKNCFQMWQNKLPYVASFQSFLLSYFCNTHLLLRRKASIAILFSFLFFLFFLSCFSAAHLYATHDIQSLSSLGLIAQNSNCLQI